MEKVIAGDGGVVINFIDFRKAFHSVYRPAVWQIMRHYGETVLPDVLLQHVEGLRSKVRSTCAL